MSFNANVSIKTKENNLVTAYLVEVFGRAVASSSAISIANAHVTRAAHTRLATVQRVVANATERREYRNNRSWNETSRNGRFHTLRTIVTVKCCVIA